MSASGETVAELYEQFAARRSRETARRLLEAFADPERAARAFGEMAAALEDAAGVVAFLSRGCAALAHAREQLDRHASALITLAGRLEEAADLSRH